jgi:hypothetical protein
MSDLTVNVIKSPHGGLHAARQSVVLVIMTLPRYQHRLREICRAEPDCMNPSDREVEFPLVWGE